MSQLHGTPGELADRIVGEFPAAETGALAYLRLAARLDVVTAVHIEPGGVAWLALHAAWKRPWITGMGTDPRAVAHCVRLLADGNNPVSGVTVERRSFGALPARLRPVEHWEWDWWYTTEPPAVRLGENLVTAVELGDPRVPALLDVANPDAMVQPGDPRIVGWFGIAAGALAPPPPTSGDERITDELVAVAAVTTMRPGIAHLGSVATHPGWRGRGLSRDLCARLTRDALAGGSPAVSLGMHAANRSARAVYSSLGYRIGYRWASGRLP